MTDSGKAEFHHPQHPLPEEIRKMKKDETVCKYCGVSYLIHREIQVLQDQLKAVKKELEHYKGLEDREKQLQEEVRQKNQRILEVEALVTQRDTIISELQIQVQDLVSSVAMETKARQDVENKLEEGATKLMELRSKQKMLVNELPSVQESLSSQRKSMNDIKTEVQQNQEAMKKFYQMKIVQILKVIQEMGKDKNTAQSEIDALKSQISTLGSSENDLQKNLTLTQQEVERLKTEEGQLVSKLKIDLEESLKRESEFQNKVSEASSKIGELENAVKDYERKVDNGTVKNKNLSVQLEHLTSQLSHKDQEIEAMMSQLRNNDLLHEEKVTKLESVIAQRENSLQEKTRLWDELRKRLHEQEKQEQLALQQASANSVQAKDLKSELERMKKDCEALKAEREMTIMAHQNQIQDLRNSFRQKMEEMQGWPDKLDRALRQERDKHRVEVENLETKFKENFTMELEIEKQKFEKMFSRNMTQLKDDESKLRAEISAVQARHRAEITEIHKQNAETKGRYQDNENALRQEVAGLKRIIADLEGRLGHLDSGESSAAISLKSQIKALERTIEEKDAAYNKLQLTIDSNKEQITFLEETVRKECEERFELTETLSAMKEELLLLKRPTGGYTSVNRSTSSTPTRRNSELADALKLNINDENQTFEKSKPLNSPYPPVKQRSEKESLASNTLNLDSSRSRTSNSGIKGGNISSRRR